jgi:hypothetical protein
MILLLMTFGLEFQGIERGRVTQELMTGRRSSRSAFATRSRNDWLAADRVRHSGYGAGGIPWTMRDISPEKMIVFKA